MLTLLSGRPFNPSLRMALLLFFVPSPLPSSPPPPQQFAEKKIFLILSNADDDGVLVGDLSPTDLRTLSQYDLKRIYQPVINIGDTVRYHYLFFVFFSNKQKKTEMCKGAPSCHGGYCDQTIGERIEASYLGD